MTIETRPSASIPAWGETGEKVQPTVAEVRNGWPLSNVPPSRQRFNWLLNFLFAGLRYFLQRGIPEWDDGETYPQHARVQYAGITYRAKVENDGAQPDTSPTEWELWGLSVSDIGTRIQAHTFRGGSFTATAGQTVFAVAHSVGGTMVFRNGVKVAFTSNGGGTEVTLTVAATVGDFVEVVSL